MRARGFTLIEVLVAISIFALVGVASYRVLSSVMQTDERLGARVEQLRVTNRAFWLLQQDIEQLMPRDVRGADGTAPETHNFLVVNNEAELPLQLTRAGRANPLGLPRSDLQRVAYRVDRHPDYDDADSPYYHDEKRYLLRYTWPTPDGSGDKARAQVQVLLAGVEKFAVAVVTTRGVVQQWPGSGAQDLPVALQFEFVLGEGAAFVRAFKVL